MAEQKTDFLIIGAGPAGLTAGYELIKRGEKPLIIEKSPRYVGGISRTEEANGYRFDIGGHRFFSKSSEVMDWWKDILQAEMITRPRSSKIFYNKKFYAYPLRATEALFNLGIIESVRCVLAYLKVRAFPIRQVRSFEDWVVNNFGRRLFQIFFKTYTEKVWGIPCNEISAEWAAQRIKGLNLFQAVLNAVKNSLGKKGDDTGKIKTLLSSFLYPKYGPGQMWETVAEKVTAQGGKILMAHQPIKIEKTETGCKVIVQDDKGSTQTIICKHLISSMPMNELVAITDIDDTAKQAAQQLKYRDFLTVALFLENNEKFEDNWIYIHDSSVQVGRVQNYKSWSPYMVPDKDKDCFGLEYFCNQSDEIWHRNDDALVSMATEELRKIGLISAQTNVLGGYVVRQEKAYPVYDYHYKQAVDNIRASLANDYGNIHCVGRNGMHKYNNQDHAMMTAMLTVANLVDGKSYDIWGVNEDAEYLEEAGISDDKKAALNSLMPTPKKLED